MKTGNLLKLGLKFGSEKRYLNVVLKQQYTL